MLAWSLMQFRQTQVFVFGGSVLPIHFRWYHSKHASQPIAWRRFSSLLHALQSHVFSYLTFFSSNCPLSKQESCHDSNEALFGLRQKNQED